MDGDTNKMDIKNILGKRFVFGVVAILAVSFVTWKLAYSGDIYLKLVGAITLIFTAGQTITDTVKK